MSFQGLFQIANISASGMAAERTRMEVAAQNIANANTTRTPQGGPYQRQQVIFATAVDDAVRDADGGALQGVQVAGIEPSDAEFPSVYRPGHPDADENGLVKMPNVQLPEEMVELMTASRAYEANLRALRSLRDMVEQTLTLLQNR